MPPTMTLPPGAVGLGAATTTVTVAAEAGGLVEAGAAVGAEVGAGAGALHAPSTPTELTPSMASTRRREGRPLNMAASVCAGGSCTLAQTLARRWASCSALNATSL